MRALVVVVAAVASASCATVPRRTVLLAELTHRYEARFGLEESAVVFQKHEIACGGRMVCACTAYGVASVPGFMPERMYSTTYSTDRACYRWSAEELAAHEVAHRVMSPDGIRLSDEWHARWGARYLILQKREPPWWLSLLVVVP